MRQIIEARLEGVQTGVTAAVVRSDCANSRERRFLDESKT
jgi:hypothetical protein